jgi:hypothetical protein
VLPVAVTVAIATAAATFTLAAALGDVRQQSDLTRTLHSASDLALVPTARAGNPTRADLSAI